MKYEYINKFSNKKFIIINNSASLIKKNILSCIVAGVVVVFRMSLSLFKLNGTSRCFLICYKFVDLHHILRRLCASAVMAVRKQCVCVTVVSTNRMMKFWIGGVKQVPMSRIKWINSKLENSNLEFIRKSFLKKDRYQKRKWIWSLRHGRYVGSFVSWSSVKRIKRAGSVLFY